MTHGLDGVGEPEAEVVVQVRAQHHPGAGLGGHPLEHLGRLDRELAPHGVGEEHRAGPGGGEGARRFGHQAVVGPGGVGQAQVYRHALVQVACPLHQVRAVRERLAGAPVRHHPGHRLGGRDDGQHPGVRDAAHRGDRLSDVGLGAPADGRGRNLPLGLDGDLPYRLELLGAHGGESGGEHHVARPVRAEHRAVLPGEPHPEAARHQRLGLRAVARRLLPHHQASGRRRLPHDVLHR